MQYEDETEKLERIRKAFVLKFCLFTLFAMLHEINDIGIAQV